MNKTIFKLVKDLIIAGILAGIGALMCSGDGTISSGATLFICLSLAGLPFGWRWASKIITAVSLKGIGLKLLFSVFLGWLAIFVVLGGDIIKFVAEVVLSKKSGSNL